MKADVARAQEAVPKTKLTDQTEADLREWAEANGEKPFRAVQLFQWLYLHQVTGWDEMTNISKKALNKVAHQFSLERIPIVEKQVAPDGTIKLLQELHDGHRIESVLLNHGDHNTVCISTQVGCAMGCKFCLTASMGLKRNLTPGEIVEQILNAQSLLPEGQTVRNIVYMGMGEPFHNYDNTIQSLKIFLNSHGFGFSARRITVSTSGIVPGIKRFAEESDIRVNLAISLNGVTQEARQKLMPVSRRYSLEELIDTCKRFPKESRKRITFEYILMKGVTDSVASARKLVSLLHGIKSKVNLIPYNEHELLPYKSPDPVAIKTFHQYLLDHGILATMRVSRGQGISAACGQLATEATSRPSGKPEKSDHPESC
jgi:23S rRNA (adenine2503-C2)-methyltransferase